MRITTEVLEVPAAVAQGVVEATVLPQVPDRRHMPPPVLAVRAEMPVQLAGEEGVPLLFGERVLPRGCRSVQEVLQHTLLQSRHDSVVTRASAVCLASSSLPQEPWPGYSLCQRKRGSESMCS